MSYTPFLKFKVNEVAAIKALDSALHRVLVPFFDLPRMDGLVESSLVKKIDDAYRKYEINLKLLPAFYIDNFDIDDSITIQGRHNYYYLLQKFSPSKIIPVVGIDRSPSHNQAVFDNATQLQSNTVAFRVTAENLDYILYEDEIKDLVEKCFECYENIHLIIDNRVCFNIDVPQKTQEISDFINKITQDIVFNKIIVTGSSIPASIRDLLAPGASDVFPRHEINLYRALKIVHPSIFLGDYTVVSPHYSDIKIEGELMRKVTAPKLFYPYADSMYITRGHAIDTHLRGVKQYNDLSAAIVAKPFYRQPVKSFGDKYLHEKANNRGKDATPSTIPKPLVNLHITYMLTDFVF